MTTTTFILPGPRPGADHRVTVHVPAGLPPAAGFPVLYALDGNAVEAELAAEPRPLQVPHAPVVVTLGHDRPVRFASEERARDYTPALGGGEAEQDARGRPSGGAGAFLQLLRAEILPRAEAIAPVDPARRALWGHSYGALFVLRTAILAPEGPALFGGYYVASPALWFGDAAFLARLHAALERDGWPGGRIAFQAGGAERARASRPDRPETLRFQQMRDALPEDALPELVAHLRRVGAAPDLTVYPGLSHGESFGRGIRDALRQVAGADPAAPAG